MITVKEIIESQGLIFIDGTYRAKLKRSALYSLAEKADWLVEDADFYVLFYAVSPSDSPKCLVFRQSMDYNHVVLELSEANKTINVSSVQIPLTDKILNRVEEIMKEIKLNSKV
jgi:hypothetical protein